VHLAGIADVVVTAGAPPPTIYAMMLWMTCGECTAVPGQFSPLRCPASAIKVF
jgi:hypothetical protein